MQLQPHFLFNTLGAIMVLVRKGEAHQAESMLARLSDLLRSALESVEAQEAPLWRELEFLRLYLSIEEVRFQDRLRVRIASDPTLTDALLPHMALQPIVENAVRHGLARSEAAVLIEVEARREADDMVLTVQDDGPGNLPLGFEGKGIGLTNTRSRLQRLYGERFSLSIENRTPRGVLVKMVLPFHVDGL
jgi:LytS/YehU family sensor histidine kinase